ncbi:MAG: CD225/dispanin family protein [Pyrinomonadaceae bacterium]
MSQNWTPPPPPSGSPANIPNNLVLAILSVFCCWPLAIVAIINATKVNSLAASGDIPGAMAASAAAKKWAMIGIGAGAVLIVIYIILMVVLGGLGAMSGR